MENQLQNKTLILGVSGGIAAYKSAELLRLLTKAGASVRVIMTRSACEFVGPLTFEALSGQPVCTSLFDRDDASIKHIDWAEQADAVVIAPATANVIGKLAGGIADDALSTLMMAVTCPVVICPSMNTNMYLSRAMQRNLDILKADGHLLLDPESGELACGTEGPGRLPEPVQIFDRLMWLLTPKDLDGKRVLVSAGPTREPIDPVRHLSNPSSGRMGYAIAHAAEHRGAIVNLISGPTNLCAPDNVSLIQVETAAQMAAAVFQQAEQSDIIIKAAAVGDYTPNKPEEHKIKKGQDQLVLTLDKTQDILKELGRRKKNQILVGFAAETQALEKNASKKLAQKNLDFIVGNLVGHPSCGFEAETNKVKLFFRDGSIEELPLMEKEAIAHLILDRILSL